MSITTLTSKGQITLPKEIRDRLTLKKGDRCQVAIGGDGLLTLERDEAPAIGHAFGMLRRLAKRKPATITEMNAAVRRRAKKKHSVKELDRARHERTGPILTRDDEDQAVRARMLIETFRGEGDKERVIFPTTSSARSMERGARATYTSTATCEPPGTSRCSES